MVDGEEYLEKYDPNPLTVHDGQVMGHWEIVEEKWREDWMTK